MIYDASYLYRIEVRVYRGDTLESRSIVCTDKKVDTVILKHSEEDNVELGTGNRISLSSK